MEWKVEYTNEFERWFDELTDGQQIAVYDRVELLRQRGPDLRRPIVGEISSSCYPNMKELRASEGGALRVLFIFDPRRTAILLLGGDKSGRWEEWYLEAIPQDYLRELKLEGLLYSVRFEVLFGCGSDEDSKFGTTAREAALPASGRR